MGIIEGHEETFGGDECAHHLDYGDSSTDAHMSNLKNCILLIFDVYSGSIICQKS